MNCFWSFIFIFKFRKFPVNFNNNIFFWHCFVLVYFHFRMRVFLFSPCNILLNTIDYRFASTSENSQIAMHIRICFSVWLLSCNLLDAQHYTLYKPEVTWMHLTSSDQFLYELLRCAITITIVQWSRAIYLLLHAFLFATNISNYISLSLCFDIGSTFDSHLTPNKWTSYALNQYGRLSYFFSLLSHFMWQHNACIE